jgi:hypothetical protein
MAKVLQYITDFFGDGEKICSHAEAISSSGETETFFTINCVNDAFIWLLQKGEKENDIELVNIEE